MDYLFNGEETLAEAKDSISTDLEIDDGQSTPKFKGIHYKIAANLIKYGVNYELSQHDLQLLSAELQSNTHHQFTVEFDEGYYVDSRLWNYVVSKLLSARTEMNIPLILSNMKEWAYIKAQDTFFTEVQDKFGPDFYKLHSDGIHIYDCIKDVPKIDFSINKKKFIKSFNNDTKYTIDKICNIRYELLLERLRGYNFNNLVSEDMKYNLRLTPVDSVSLSSKGVQVLIGILSLTKDGDLCIQGTLNEVQISINPDCNIEKGIYCDGNVVIMQGIMEPFKNIFRVDRIRHPPITYKNELHIQDFFGGSLSNTNLILFNNYTNFAMSKEINSSWIIIANLHLDKSNTIKGLEDLFNSYIDMYHQQGLPSGFIFMGNFSSYGYNFEYQHSWIDKVDSSKNVTNPMESYSSGFDSLYKLLTNPKYLIILSNCYIVLIPGPSDATLCKHCLPRLPLLNHCINRFKDRLEAARPQCKGRIVMSTNPCRIRHWGRRMLFLREELLTKLLWEAILKSSTSETIDTRDNLIDMLIETIIGQAHLSPNKPGHSTVIQHDSALLLHPLPDFTLISTSLEISSLTIPTTTPLKYSISDEENAEKHITTNVADTIIST